VVIAQLTKPVLVMNIAYILFLKEDQSDDDSDEVQITDHRRRIEATSPVLERRRYVSVFTVTCTGYIN